jgi:fluoride exporter
MTWIFVALGGALGSTARYGMARAVPIPIGGWPWATLIVNLSGSFLIGLLYMWFATRGPGSDNVRLFWITGVLGGFTTFSAFALETTLLGLSMTAIGYVCVTVVGCLLAAWLGMQLGTLTVS